MRERVEGRVQENALPSHDDIKIFVICKYSFLLKRKEEGDDANHHYLYHLITYVAVQKGVRLRPV